MVEEKKPCCLVEDLLKQLEELKIENKRVMDDVDFFMKEDDESMAEIGRLRAHIRDVENERTELENEILDLRRDYMEKLVERNKMRELWIDTSEQINRICKEMNEGLSVHRND